jgi:hypothetical protein
MVPYLKGIHLSLDSWRANRDEDGWRRMNHVVEPRLDIEERVEPPKFVEAVARLKQDVEALMSFTDVRAPPSVPIRPTSVTVAHLWGDASGAGFGSSLWIKGEGEIDLVYGTWDEEVANQSSNFREAYNLVLRVEQLVRDRRIIRGSELWLFTDNMVSERSFFKGSNKNPELHKLCLRLRRLEMFGALFLHAVWVAGTWMINQGSDGLSRGDLTSGVMRGGEDFLDHPPE